MWRIPLCDNEICEIESKWVITKSQERAVVFACTKHLLWAIRVQCEDNGEAIVRPTGKERERMA